MNLRRLSEYCLKMQQKAQENVQNGKKQNADPSSIAFDLGVSAAYSDVLAKLDDSVEHLFCHECKCESCEWERNEIRKERDTRWKSCQAKTDNPDIFVVYVKKLKEQGIEV